MLFTLKAVWVGVKVIDLEASPVRRCFDGDVLIYQFRALRNAMFRAAQVPS